MRLTSLIALAAAVVASIEHWSEGDIRQFLADRNVEVEKGISEDDLRQLAADEWTKLGLGDRVAVDVNSEGQQHVLDMATNPNANLNDLLPYHNWDFLVKNDGEGNVSDWLFDSWSTLLLKKFLKDNKIKADNNKKLMLQAIKDNWNKITETHHTLGLYPGDWVYLGWLLNDFKQWLTNFDVEFDPKATRDELLKKVREVNYYASEDFNDSKNLLLELLDLEDADIYDAAGKIKETFWDSWLASQLRDWLYYHGYLDSRAYDDSWDLGKLKKTAESHANDLQDDINLWVEQAKDKALPYLQRGKKLADNVINDTFSNGVDRWTKDRLKQFLRLRGVPYSPFASKLHLVELVRKNRQNAVKKGAHENFEWLVGGLGSNYLSGWLKNKAGIKLLLSRPDILRTLSDYLSGSLNSAKDLFKDQLKYYKLSFEDYSEDLQARADHVHKKHKKIAEKDAQRAYDAFTRYYDEAAHQVEGTIDNAHNDVDEALQLIQDAAVEYLNNLYDGWESGKKDVEDSAQSVKKAADEFAASLSEELTEAAAKAQEYAAEQAQKAKNKAGKVAGDAEEAWHDAQDYVLDLVNQGKKKAQKVHKDAKKAALQKADEVADQVEEGAKQVHAEGLAFADRLQLWFHSLTYQLQRKVHYYLLLVLGRAHEQYEKLDHDALVIYGEAKKSGSSALKEGKKTGAKVADDIYTKAGEAREELDKQAADAAAYAGKKADEAYTEAGKHAENAKEWVDEKVDDAKAHANVLSKEAKAEGEVLAHDAKEALHTGWALITDAFENADLIAYLQSFGFEHRFLKKLNRRQLKTLAKEQLKVFYGAEPVWDRLIRDILTDGTDSLLVKLGLKKESSWHKLKLW